jgi:hypothetical protein
MGSTSSIPKDPPMPGAGGCPVDHGDRSRNNIPADLANHRVSSLSTERELSSIPRAEDEPSSGSTCPMHATEKGKEPETWVYPSPQQFRELWLDDRRLV